MSRIILNALRPDFPADFFIIPFFDENFHTWKYGSFYRRFFPHIAALSTLLKFNSRCDIRLLEISGIFICPLTEEEKAMKSARICKFDDVFVLGGQKFGLLPLPVPEGGNISVSKVIKFGRENGAKIGNKGSKIYFKIRCRYSKVIS